MEEESRDEGTSLTPEGNILSQKRGFYEAISYVDNTTSKKAKQAVVEEDVDSNNIILMVAIDQLCQS